MSLPPPNPAFSFSGSPRFLGSSSPAVFSPQRGHNSSPPPPCPGLSAHSPITVVVAHPDGVFDGTIATPAPGDTSLIIRPPHAAARPSQSAFELLNLLEAQADELTPAELARARLLFTPPGASIDLPVDVDVVIPGAPRVAFTFSGLPLTVELAASDFPPLDLAAVSAYLSSVPLSGEVFQLLYPFVAVHPRRVIMESRESPSLTEYSVVNNLPFPVLYQVRPRATAPFFVWPGQEKQSPVLFWAIPTTPRSVLIPSGQTVLVGGNPHAPRFANGIWGNLTLSLLP